MPLPLSPPLTVILPGVFAGPSALILSDRFHKPSAAILGATLMVCTGVLKPTDIIGAINWTALGVLLVQFILPSSLRQLGLFEWIELYLARPLTLLLVMLYIVLRL